MAESKLRDLSMQFSVELLQTTETIKHHFSVVNQLERAGTSIGANIYEANYAQSRADFISKLQIALKECHEAMYWLTLAYRIQLTDPTALQKLLDRCGTIQRMLISSIKTAKQNE